MQFIYFLIMYRYPNIEAKEHNYFLIIDYSKVRLYLVVTTKHLAKVRWEWEGKGRGVKGVRKIESSGVFQTLCLRSIEIFIRIHAGTTLFKPVFKILKYFHFSYKIMILTMLWFSIKIENLIYVIFKKKLMKFHGWKLLKKPG